MKIKSSSAKGSFLILDKETAVAEIKYKSWFSSTASTELNGKQIQIKSKNIWNSKFDIIKNGIDKGDIRFNWLGAITINYELNNQEKVYSIKHKGLLKSRFEIYDEDKKLVLKMSPSFNWRNNKYDYALDFQPAFKGSSDEQAEFLIYCTYTANLYMLHMNGLG